MMILGKMWIVLCRFRRVLYRFRRELVGFKCPGILCGVLRRFLEDPGRCLRVQGKLCRGLKST